jgi:ADP-ribose pyrophosphatase YjhB (NUDIX family)
MPQAVSKKQYRMMMAIANKGNGTTSRGDSGPPPSVANKYTEPGKDAPESKGKEFAGGKWGDAKKNKKEEKVKKTDNPFYYYFGAGKRRGAGALVFNDDGEVLLGRRNDNNKLACPGGTVEAHETFIVGAAREVEEETCLEEVMLYPEPIFENVTGDMHSKTFLCIGYEGTPKSNGELLDLKFWDIKDIPMEECTDYTRGAIKKIVEKFAKTNPTEETEELYKTIVRSDYTRNAPSIDPADAMSIVGNSAFRYIKRSLDGMENETIRDIHLDTYTITIRKHSNDIYSGRIVNGHKIVHHFKLKSLPEVALEIMSTFEWYLPEDTPFEDILVDDLPDEVLNHGSQLIADDYRRNSIANIYDEVEEIRREIRHESAVDIQQVEERMMTIFDKMQEVVAELSNKHNSLANATGTDIDSLFSSINKLQSKIDGMAANKPSVVEAISTNPPNPSAILNSHYNYLPKPKIEILPSGKITISFSDEWAQMEQENFLEDMKAKAIKKLTDA